MWTVHCCQTVIFAYFCLKRSGNLVEKKNQADDQLITQSIKEGRYCFLYLLFIQSTFRLIKEQQQRNSKMYYIQWSKVVQHAATSIEGNQKSRYIKTMSKDWI